MTVRQAVAKMPGAPHSARKGGRLESSKVTVNDLQTSLASISSGQFGETGLTGGIKAT